MIKLLEGMINEGEGNITLFPHRVEMMKKLLITYKPQYIVEIGFNLGHSCKLIIDTLQSLEDYGGIKKIYIFDICEFTNDVYRNGVLFKNVGGAHSYVKTNFEIMKNYYNIDMQLIVGDSLLIVKPFIDSLDHELDFVEVDGFHECIAPKHDIESTVTKIKKDGVLYIDDYISMYPAIISAVDSTDWSNFDTYRNNDIFYAVKK